MSAGLTPMTVRALWSFLQRKYRTDVIDKRRSPEMRVAAWFIERFAKIPVHTFMTRYATTIGRRIYVPFIIGDPSRGFGLWEQAVLAVHEHQHVEQLKRDGWLKFALTYLASSKARAAYEADAYRTALELEYWKSGHVPPIRPYAERLSDYGCNSRDIEMARKMLVASARTIVRGGVVTPAAKMAIAWLDEHAPGIKRSGKAN